MKPEQFTTADLSAMVLTASAELASRWIAGRQDRGASLRPHMEAGAGVELLVQLAPSVAMSLRLVDSDGSFAAINSLAPGGGRPGSE